MEKTAQELLKAYVNSQQFISTTEIMSAIKDIFRDVLQQVMECIRLRRGTSGGLG